MENFKYDWMADAFYDHIWWDFRWNQDSTSIRLINIVNVLFAINHNCFHANGAIEFGLCVLYQTQSVHRISDSIDLERMEITESVHS